MACPDCGAPNAASRQQCARCKTDLHGDPETTSAAIAQAAAGDAEEAAAERDGPSRAVIAGTVIALVAGIAVMIAILSAQGIGPFAPDVADVLADAEAVEVVDVRASSELPSDDDGDYEAGNVIDGSTGTAWVAGRGAPGWIELDLGEVTDVVGIVVWNGYQADDRFSRHDRVSSLVIETDDRRFAVDLLDTRGPLAVDLPEPVPASRIRLIVEEVFSGDEVDGPALSLVEVRTTP